MEADLLALRRCRKQSNRAREQWFAPDATGCKVSSRSMEIFIGGPRPGKRGRGAQGKVLVVVAAQQAAKGIGRIRLTRVVNASARSLEPTITAAIEVGSQVRTDDWRG